MLRTLHFTILITLAFATVAAASETIQWKPVTPAELSMREPVVDKDADAEAIFWEVRLDDKSRKKLYYEHYVRVKIFTERGRERFAKMDIPYTKRMKVENIAARVIKPDGSITNVSASEIFDREIIKSKRLKIRAKSFAVPGIEPGVIVEYQYRERFKSDSLQGERLVFQRDIPIQRVTYYMRPFRNSNIDPYFFNMEATAFSRDPNDDSFWVASVKNAPAFNEEPFMPPKDQVVPWAMLRYSFSRGDWWQVGQGVGSRFASVTEPNKKIKSLAENLARGANTDEEKLRRFYTYVQTEIRNLAFDDSRGETKLPKQKKVSDVFKTNSATPGMIDMVFASLARAAGFQTYVVFSGDRSEKFFNPNSHPYSVSFIHPLGVAVVVDGKRRYFNPGTPFLPFGELIWYEENVYAMVAYGGNFRWATTPLSKPENSLVKRTGNFELDADGVLKGTATRAYNGHWAHEQRRSEYLETDNERAEHFEEELKSDNSTAEISNVAIRNFFEASKPLEKSYAVTIPGYGQKTGSRIFLQPGFFEYNSKPMFTSATREHDIYFDFPWSEDDDIEIKLPADYALEKFSLPKDIKESKGIAGSSYKIKYDRENHSIRYTRKYFIGGNGQIYFKKGAYKPLKRLFDLFHESDTFVLILKKKAV
ncbi:MAG: DUF3857 and transglutaminase domain-containing protein [Pyrinomonadaceae bacterium]|nr:DUF3857 and transglutaminase domain-containing protein [Pyrinomonadaceae bacterium]